MSLCQTLRRCATHASIASGIAVATCALLAPCAMGQSPHKKIALRQAFRNDSFVLEAAFDSNKPNTIPQAQPASLIPVERPTGPPPLSGATRSVLNYYGSRRVASTLRQMPQRQFVSATTPPPAASAAGNRPFESVEDRPTVSAYMGLFREDFDEVAPNYFTYVRPQIQRDRANERQQREIDRLSRQRQSAAQPAGPPTSGRVARYGDTGQFYSRWTR